MGAILFGIAVLFLVLNATIQLWYILVTLCLCLLAFVLFLVEVIIILLFWKQTCFCKRCAVPTQGDVHFADYCDPLCTAGKLDLMTSVSDVRIPPGGEEGIPEHCYRKLGQPRRRQYVDRPSSARFASDVEFAKCQTDSPAMTHIQSQASSTN
ncbi:uncharacterized protein LOC117219190 [Megalopta genalis]|uniref:uncharacterized protein LOC117219190 n=1 Tax=Megalopta genalis TaxID=115081 RepID=UPI0014432A77|nr:uncharacterized protein LOC117219190 [Megalopta genalis]